MNRSERIQLQILILLLVALATSITYFSGTPRDPISPAASPRILSKNKNLESDNLPKMTMLENRLPEFKDVHRNVFEFADGQSEPLAEIIEEPVTLSKPTAAIPIQEGPDVNYLGFYQEKEGSGRKLAAISNGGQIYVGGIGEVLAGKYKVLRLEDEFIEVEYLPEKRVIRLEIGRDGLPPAIK